MISNIIDENKEGYFPLPEPILFENNKKSMSPERPLSVKSNHFEMIAHEDGGDNIAAPNAIDSEGRSPLSSGRKRLTSREQARLQSSQSNRLQNKSIEE